MVARSGRQTCVSCDSGYHSSSFTRLTGCLSGLLRSFPARKSRHHAGVAQIKPKNKNQKPEATMKNPNQCFTSPLLKTCAVAAAALAVAFAPDHVLAQRPIGIDVSSYQGQPNWTSVHNAGIAFAWAKATEGTTIVDGDFAYNEVNGKNAGVLMGAYHFAHPNLNTPAAEASYFWGQA